MLRQKSYLMALPQQAPQQAMLHPIEKEKINSEEP